MTRSRLVGRVAAMGAESPWKGNFAARMIGPEALVCRLRAGVSQLYMDVLGNGVCQHNSGGIYQLYSLLGWNCCG